MNLTEMHVWFRQYAQQMGMQNVRAILPEQIDMLINTSISDILNQLIRENIGVTNDRIITDNSKIGQINALRSLYTVDEIPMFGTSVTPAGMLFLAKNKNIGKMSNRLEDGTLINPVTAIPDALFFVDFALSYKKVNKGFEGTNGAGTIVEEPSDEHKLETNYFPVRLIDDAYLADTLNDFVLKNRIRTPILVIYNKSISSAQSSNNVTFDLYIDTFIKYDTSVDGTVGTNYRLEQDLIPNMFRISYIAKPKKVKYLKDMGADNIECDLPESMHIDILKHAVDLYNISISGNLHAAQQQQQNQNREMTRNNARPDNEGYQN